MTWTSVKIILLALLFTLLTKSYNGQEERKSDSQEQAGTVPDSASSNFSCPSLADRVPVSGGPALSGSSWRVTLFAWLAWEPERSYRSGAGKTERKTNTRKLIIIHMVGFHFCYKFEKKRCWYISCVSSGWWHYGWFFFSIYLCWKEICDFYYTSYNLYWMQKIESIEFFLESIDF